MAFINIFKSGCKVTSPKNTGTKVVPQVVPQVDTSLPKALQTIYKPHYDTFNNWMILNRKHQVDAYVNCNKSTKGQISLPTGTGKTRVQIALHIAKMIEMSKNNETGVFVIGAHRLGLCSQLLSELIEVAVNAGISFDILFNGSERYSEDKVHCKFKNQGFNSYVNRATSTTKRSDIFGAVYNAHAKGRHVIAVSTYHSWHKLDVLDSITQATYDEAHTLIGEDFYNNITFVMPKINYNYFFTATRKVQGASEGMNNTEIFGEVLCEIPPRKMIRMGESVPPKLHIIQTNDIINNGEYQNLTMEVRTLIAGYEQHKYLVESHVNSNFKNVKLGAKLLVSTTGNLQMFNLHNHIEFRTYCKEHNINVFAFSSSEGVFYNFEKVSRTQALENMNNMADSDHAIMLHIDILTEGIDVPSVTGIMPFRELNTIKLLQTMGRGARLLKTDRIGLYNGTIKPMDFDSYIKPCVWVILPEHFRSLGNSEAMKNTLKTIVNSYEVPIEEYNSTDRYLAVNDESVERITEQDQSTRADRETGLTHIILNILDEKFNLGDIKQTTIDKGNILKDVLFDLFSKEDN